MTCRSSLIILARYYQRKCLERFKKKKHLEQLDLREKSKFWKVRDVSAERQWSMILVISVCEYFVHTECQDFAVADCKENATYLPGKDLAQVKHTHHWREGNLPSSSKCAVCKKNCVSAECLSGFRCEWCGMTVNVLPLF